MSKTCMRAASVLKESRGTDTASPKFQEALGAMAACQRFAVPFIIEDEKVVY